MNSIEEYSRAMTQKRIQELEDELMHLRMQHETLRHQHGNDEAALRMLTYKLERLNEI
jgi:ribosomal protein L29